MNYKDNTKGNMEQDDMDIKSHLNASLDLDDIRVSEDLINRTLEAIKKQPADTTDIRKTSDENSKRVIPWGRYARGFAGVAAAVLIVVIGYQTMILNAPKKSMNSAQAPNMSNDEVNQDSAIEDAKIFASEEAQTENGIAASGTQDEMISATDVEAPTEYTITAKTSAAENKSKDTGEVNSKESNTTSVQDNVAVSDTQAADAGTIAGIGEGEAASSEMGIASFTKKTDQDVALSFREIFLPEQAEYINISDDVNKTTITLTDKEAIRNFYTVMDQYTFTYSSDQTIAQDYTVVTKSPTPSETLYTLLVGDSIIVRQTTGDIASETVYKTANAEMLKKELTDFYNKYNQ
jgi:hypothetical protein